MSNHWQVKSEIFEAPATYRPNGLSRSDSSGSESLVSQLVVYVNVAARLAVCVCVLLLSYHHLIITSGWV